MNRHRISQGLAQVRSILIPFVTVLMILVVSIVIIAYGRGYRLDVTQQTVSTTGLLALTSDPTSAAVYINDQLTTVTNDTLSLDPGWYSVRVEKEGYQPWEKQVKILGEVVTRADIYFFPSTPSLSVTSRGGIRAPTISPEGARIAYVIPRSSQLGRQSDTSVERSGLWVHDLSSNPLSLSRGERKIADSTVFDLSQSTLLWSPDGQKILAVSPHPITAIPLYYLLDATRLNETVTTFNDFESLETEWKAQTDLIRTRELELLKGDARRIATSSGRILSFAPDESKILYEATSSTVLAKVLESPIVGSNATNEDRILNPGSLYVYDIKEDRNYRLGDVTSFLDSQPTPTPEEEPEQFALPLEDMVLEYLDRNAPPPLQWLSTSKHLVFLKENKLQTMEFDGSITQTIYSGPMEHGFLAPWTGANRILILANFNPQASELPTLYSVNLR